jgi:hypothetical protein
MAANETRRALGDVAARKLANTTKTPPQLTAITPRWLVQLLSWVPVESGTYRVNKAKNEEIDVVCGARDERKIPESFVDYEEKPREYTLSAISTIVDVHTRVSDLYSHPYDQIREQLRLTVEKVKERQEHELVNNPDYGLLHNVAPESRVKPRKGAQPRTISMSYSRRSGRSRPSSSPIRAPSLHSAASARVAAFLRPQPPSSGRPSSPGGASRSSRPTSSRWMMRARAISFCCAPARSDRESSVSSSPAFPASRPPVSPSDSWASIATPSPPTSSRSTAPPPC